MHLNDVEWIAMNDDEWWRMMMDNYSPNKLASFARPISSAMSKSEHPSNSCFSTKVRLAVFVDPAINSRIISQYSDRVGRISSKVSSDYIKNNLILSEVKQIMLRMSYKPSRLWGARKTRANKNWSHWLIRLSWRARLELLNLCMRKSFSEPALLLLRLLLLPSTHTTKIRS